MWSERVRRHLSQNCRIYLTNFSRAETVFWRGISRKPREVSQNKNTQFFLPQVGARRLGGVDAAGGSGAPAVCAAGAGEGRRRSPPPGVSSTLPLRNSQQVQREKGIDRWSSISGLFPRHEASALSFAPSPRSNTVPVPPPGLRR